MSLPTAGEPSRRPTPTRTLPQPSRMSVAHREAPSTSIEMDSTPGTLSDADALRKDLHRRADLSRKAEKWSDRLMEDTPDRRTFKKALIYLNPRQYRDITHERHLNNLCSYPACANPPSAPYSSAKRFRISTTNRTIREKEGNEEDGFCSRRCGVRSKWVEDQLGESPIWARREKGAGGVRLLEDIEEELRASTEAQQPESTNETNGHGVERISTPRNVAQQTPETGKATGTTTSATVPPRAAPQPLVRLKPIPEPLLSTGDTPSATSDLLANLTIVERPTPPVQPVPPSLTAPTPLPELKSPPPETQSRRSAGAALIATPGKLANTLVNASRQMGPLPQLAPDSEDEEEKGDWGEGEMGLSWGEEDDEVRDLFAEAMAARELIPE